MTLALVSNRLSHYYRLEAKKAVRAKAHNGREQAFSRSFHAVAERVEMYVCHWCCETDVSPVNRGMALRLVVALAIDSAAAVPTTGAFIFVIFDIFIIRHPQQYP